MKYTLEINGNTADIHINDISSDMALAIHNHLNKLNEFAICTIPAFKDFELKAINECLGGNRIMAIKNFKEHTNTGLKDAKERVDELVDIYQAVQKILKK